MAHHPGFAYHSGITMHKLPVGGNAMGALFALAAILVILVGIPLARWFFVGAAAIGVILSIFTIRWHLHHKIEIKDLSALEEPNDKNPNVKSPPPD